MIFRVLPEAEVEAIEAAIWDEERHPSLGDEFLTAVGDGFARTQESPDVLPLLESYAGPHQIRRLLLRRFPFVIVYLYRPDVTIVTAIAHTHRRPNFWLSRISNP